MTGFNPDLHGVHNFSNATGLKIPPPHTHQPHSSFSEPTVNVKELYPKPSLDLGEVQVKRDSIDTDLELE